jgi:hypothetical protein
MNKREEIKAEIDKIDQEHLDRLHEWIKAFPGNVTYLKKKASEDKRPILDNLRDIKIDGPADLSTNWNLYASGEKRIEDNSP